MCRRSPCCYWAFSAPLNGLLPGTEQTEMEGTGGSSMKRAEHHDDRWRAIRSSHLASLYLGEAQALVNSCLKSSRRLTELAPADLGNALKANEEVLSQAHVLVSAAGRLRNLLFAAKRTQKESEKGTSYGFAEHSGFGRK